MRWFCPEVVVIFHSQGVWTLRLGIRIYGRHKRFTAAMAIDRLPKFVIKLSLMMICLKQARACAYSPFWLSAGSSTSSPPGGGDLLAAAVMMNVEYGLVPQYSSSGGDLLVVAMMWSEP